MRWVLLVLAGCGFRPAAAQQADGGNVQPTDGRVDAKMVVRPIDAPPDAQIPIAFVQKASQTGHADISVTFASPQNVGDLDVVVVAWIGGLSALTVTDTAGNIYSEAGTDSNSNFTQAVFYAPNIAAAAAGNVVTASFGTSQGNSTLRAIEYSGLAASPLDAMQTSKGNGSTASASVTTSNAHDLIYVGETSDQTATGAGTGYTERLLVDGDLVEDRVVTTAGTQQASVPLNQTANWVVTMVAFKAAS